MHIPYPAYNVSQKSESYKEYKPWNTCTVTIGKQVTYENFEKETNYLNIFVLYINLKFCGIFLEAPDS